MAGITPLTFHVPAKAPTSSKIMIGVFILFTLLYILISISLILSDLIYQACNCDR